MTQEANQCAPETETPSPTSKVLKEDIIKTLKTCYDPEIPVDIYELGLIYKLDVESSGVVRVSMTLTSPMCPVAESLPPQVESKIRAVEGVKKASVEVVWDLVADLA